MSLLLTPMAVGQIDTVQWGYNKYHYSVWYDTLPEFYDTMVNTGWTLPPPALRLYGWCSEPRNKMLAVPQHVDYPTLVYGISVTEPMCYDSVGFHLTNILHHCYLPEYVYLFQKVGDTLEMRDSVRWDTVTPKVMKIALNADTQRYGFKKILVYEAMFKDPVLVDSLFYTVSTNNGKASPMGSRCYDLNYFPVIPMCVFNNGMVHYPQWCPKPSWYEPKIWDMQTRTWTAPDYPFNSPIFGMYFPIVDYVELIVTSADTAMGTAGPVAHVARNTMQNIYAVPKRGYRFSHWQEDGGIHATRPVYVVNDTTRYTAQFEPLEAYRVEGASNDETMGYVTVYDSVYYEGETAVLEAIALEGMKFRRWSNGSTENPLSVVVSSDTLLTAYFSAKEQYRVEGASEDEEKGYVLGGGTYLEDDTARLEAFPRDGRYRFGWWSDGQQANPYDLVVSGDTVVTAYFLLNPDYTGIESAGRDGEPFVVTPNPARGRATVELREGAERGAVVQMHDASGHEVLNEPLEAGTQRQVLDLRRLAQGAYFVTVKTPTFTSTRKLVVEWRWER